MLLWASKFDAAKYRVQLRYGQVNTFGGTSYFAVDCTYHKKFHVSEKMVNCSNKRELIKGKISSKSTNRIFN